MGVPRWFTVVGKKSCAAPRIPERSRKSACISPTIFVPGRAHTGTRGYGHPFYVAQDQMEAEGTTGFTAGEEVRPEWQDNAAKGAHLVELGFAVLGCVGNPETSDE